MINLFKKGKTLITCSIIIIFSSATFIRNNVWQDDIRLWEDVVLKTPHKPRGHSFLGNAYYLNGYIDQAIEQHIISINLNPKDANNYNNLGVAYAKKGALDVALEMYNKAISIDPDSTSAYTNRGYLLAQKGDIDGAIRDYNHAIRINPFYADAYGNRGIAHDMCGKYDMEIADFETAISLKPFDAEAYFNLGLALLRRTGQHRKAIELFNKVINLDPNSTYTYAYGNRGFAYYNLGLAAQAIPDFQKACGMGDDKSCKALESALAEANNRVHGSVIVQ